MRRQWVVDASPIILLAKADSLHLLPACTDQILIPQVVAEEVRRAGDDDPARQWLETGGESWVDPAGEIAPEVAAWDLGRGERHVLSWALKREGWTAVVDDGAARRCAEALGVSVIGTLGVLLVAKREGALDAVRPVVSALVRGGLHVDEALIERVLELADET